MVMEQAPQGTFQDELDWCIQQLETGLLHRHPTQQQASDSQRILRVLRSRKAPFVKKRQVMNQVFGNYRQKMAEERKLQEKAAKNPPQAHIQEVSSPDTQSVVYRKCSGSIESTSTHWFQPSDNSFSFSFCLDKKDPCEDGGLVNSQDTQVQCEDVGALDIGDGSGFTFDFQILEDKAPSSQNSESHNNLDSALDLPGDHPSPSQTSPAVINVEAAQAGSSQNLSNLEQPCSTSTLLANKNIALKTSGQTATDSPKKKKKKSQKKNQTGLAEKTVEGSRNAEKLPPAKEEPQSGADDLRRELDWCVEQLEIGLQRKKSTPKQVEEALRTIKTLRSEKVPLVKKRQVMRTMFGDYRRKMEEERQKQTKLMQAAVKSARVCEVSAAARQKSSKVFRKSSHNSTTGQKLPAISQDLPAALPVPETSNQGGFLLQSSQEPFCFNFF
ncbi:UPF0488 protein C8orf33 homolog [Hyperolius riggenbachi]|uniref:UPF0488 protein C8orf33 homolog n=1 Tax=Hyperolius riggenbachi TaxID=752182 RepID=UPI0035A39A04